MTEIGKRLRAFANLNAWVLIILGLLLFSARVQFEPGGFVNLPVAFTVLQTGGLMFSLFGLQIMASMATWPELNVPRLLAQVTAGNTSAGIVLAGLLLFNGLSLAGVTYWVTAALGAGVGR